MRADAVVSFGPFEIDPRSLELRRGGVPIALEPLPARILARLAADLGSMVPREELLVLGWPGTPELAKQSLNTCVYQIRKALAEGGPSPVRLATLRGRGYRLSVAPATRAGPLDRGGGRVRKTAVAGLALAAVAAGSLWTIRAARRAHDPPAEARRILERAKYLALETRDLEAARAVLDTGRVLLPDVASVHAEWAEINFWLGDLSASRVGAERALALDPRVATAHRTQGGLAMLRGDWAEADASLDRALSLDRSDTRTLIALAYLRTIQRRPDDARRLVDEAVRLDPLSASVHQDAGLAYLLMGRYEAAGQACRETLRFRPRSPWAVDCLFDVAVLSGRPDQAARWGRRLLELYHATSPPADLPAAGVVARTEAWRLHAWTGAVDRGAYPFGLALACAANGRADEALRALREAAEHPRLELLAMAVDPRLASLRGRPAFREIEDQLGLPASYRTARSPAEVGVQPLSLSSMAVAPSRVTR